MTKAKSVSSVPPLEIPDSNIVRDDVGTDTTAAQGAQESPIMLARLEYAATRGWWTFPAPTDGSKKSLKDKEHSGTRWGATIDTTVIRDEFKSNKFRKQNVGIMCGVESGIIVIETDTAEHGDGIDGEASLKIWEIKHGALSETLMARAPSGSLHRFFNHPGTGIKVKSFNAILGPRSGVDCKGDGGMVMGVPSVMPPRPATGNKPAKVGGVYQWVNAGHPIADAPQALLDIVKEKTIIEHALAVVRTAGGKKSRGENAWAVAAFDGEVRKLESTAIGERNEQLNTSAFNLGQIVAGGSLNESDVFNVLMSVADAIGLVKDDGRTVCKNTINSGLTSGKLTPRNAPVRENIIRHEPKQPPMKVGDERAANQAPIATDLPVIQIHNRISVLTTEAQGMLMGAGVPFYQRSGELVRPIIRTVQAAHGHLTKTAQLKIISATHLRDTLCRHALWERFDERKATWVTAVAPMNVAETLLERDGVWGFPEIVGVIATPTLRPDGSLLIKQGYDPATRLLLIEPPPMPPIPDKPTREDALKALALLEGLIVESPFADEPSRSVALSGLITPVVRGAFPVAPLHAASAPVAGTGKSHLQDMGAAISSGQQRMPVIAAGDEKETEKRLTGVMLTGQPLVSIDNVNGELKGDFLCQAIEQHVLDLRPLGRSDIIRVATRAITFYATGNNIIIVGDLCRRTITSRLDSNLENPQLRQFKNNPIQKILSDRGTYIAACLTICRAYIIAGRPGLLPRLASFEGWSDFVRSALKWLGKADAVDSMTNTQAEDPHRAALSDLLHAWAQDHGIGSGSNVSIAVIFEKSVLMEKKGGMETGEFKFPELNAAVRAAAMQVDSPSSKIDPARFGNYCRSKKGRIIDGLRLMNKPSSRGGVATWWVEQVGAG